MEGLGYSEAKPLKVKVVDAQHRRSTATPRCILIDQLKKIYIDGELEVVDTSIWHAKVTRKEYSVGLNLTGVGVDDPDVNLLRELQLQLGAQLTQYCNKEVDALIDKQSQELDIDKRKKIVWEIERKLAEDCARPIINYDAPATCWQPQVKGFVLHQQQHLQQLALRGRVAGQVSAARTGVSAIGRVESGSLSRPPLPADAADAVRHVGADLRHAAAGAGQHHRHHLRLGGLR